METPETPLDVMRINQTYLGDLLAKHSTLAMLKATCSETNRQGHAILANLRVQYHKLPESERSAFMQNHVLPAGRTYLRQMRTLIESMTQCTNHPHSSI